MRSIIFGIFLLFLSICFQIISPQFGDADKTSILSSLRYSVPECKTVFSTVPREVFNVLSPRFILSLFFIIVINELISFWQVFNKLFYFLNSFSTQSYLSYHNKLIDDIIILNVSIISLPLIRIYIFSSMPVPLDSPCPFMLAYLFVNLIQTEYLNVHQNKTLHEAN